MPLAFELREPTSAAEFELYRDLRWSILRQPLGIPRSSDSDDQPGVIHLAAWLDGQAIGAGRIYFNSPEEAQIRGVAVDEGRSRQGVGSAIIAELERRMKDRGARRIIVNARDKAVGFYEKLGYRVLNEPPGNFHSIRHFKMVKEI